MVDFVDGTAFNFEQGQRARKLFAAVVLAALDDAIADDKKFGNGADQIARWARSKDGREVLSCAGIDPNERVVKGLMEFVGKGVRTSIIGPVDRALGFGFGALKGLILASLLYLLLVLVTDTFGGGPRERPDWVTQARTYPLLNATSGSIAEFVERRRKGEPIFADEPQ